jgi:hypothetical protein
MPDDSPVLPTSRIARWVAAGVLIILAVALYLRDGRRLAPLTATPAPPQSGQPTR